METDKKAYSETCESRKIMQPENRDVSRYLAVDQRQTKDKLNRAEISAEGVLDMYTKVKESGKLDKRQYAADAWHKKQKK